MSSSRVIYRSSSTGGFGTFDNFKPVRSQVAAWAKKDESLQELASNVENSSTVTTRKQPSEKPKQSSKVIFTLGSSIWEENSWEQPRVDNSGKHFTEVCAWISCTRKYIKSGEDAYMYGYLQAFCSEECRNKQIALDEKLRPPPPETEESRTLNTSLQAVFEAYGKAQDFLKSKIINSSYADSVGGV